MLLRIYLYSCLPFVCLLLRNAYSNILPIFYQSFRLFPIELFEVFLFLFLFVYFCFCLRRSFTLVTQAGVQWRDLSSPQPPKVLSWQAWAIVPGPNFQLSNNNNKKRWQDQHRTLYMQYNIILAGYSHLFCILHITEPDKY